MLVLVRRLTGRETTGTMIRVRVPLLMMRPLMLRMRIRMLKWRIRMLRIPALGAVMLTRRTLLTGIPLRSWTALPRPLRRKRIGQMDRRTHRTHALRCGFHGAPSPRPWLIELPRAAGLLRELPLVAANVHAAVPGLKALTRAARSQISNGPSPAIQSGSTNSFVVGGQRGSRHSCAGQQNAFVRELRRLRKGHTNRIVWFDARSKSTIVATLINATRRGGRRNRGLVVQGENLVTERWSN